MKAAEFVIVTGVSGAGKSEAIKVFEDMGFFCIDNLPTTLLSKLAELFKQTEGGIDKIALVIDARGRELFDSLFEELATLEELGINYRILFLEADDETLINRYKKTRRRHPLAPEGRISEAIEKEREILQEIKGNADKIIDTTNLNLKEFKSEMKNKFINVSIKNQMTITILSFGFKHGLPKDADLMFDVRFLANPHYIDSLRELTGLNEAVQEYVLRWPLTKKFKEKLFDMIEFLLPNYINEGKTHLTIAIGCTGGQHRSVTLVEKIKEKLANRYNILVEHRDI